MIWQPRGACPLNRRWSSDLAMGSSCCNETERKFKGSLKGLGLASNSVPCQTDSGLSLWTDVACLASGMPVLYVEAQRLSSVLAVRVNQYGAQSATFVMLVSTAPSQGTPWCLMCKNQTYIVGISELPGTQDHSNMYSSPSLLSTSIAGLRKPTPAASR